MRNHYRRQHILATDGATLALDWWVHLSSAALSGPTFLTPTQQRCTHTARLWRAAIHTLAISAPMCGSCRFDGCDVPGYAVSASLHAAVAATHGPGSVPPQLPGTLTPDSPILLVLHGALPGMRLTPSSVAKRPPRRAATCRVLPLDSAQRRCAIRLPMPTTRARPGCRHQRRQP
jgi:hypothetical protein